MTKIPLSESIRLKQSLQTECGDGIVMLGFTFHFLSRHKVISENLSGHLIRSGFAFVRIVPVKDTEDYMLEVTKCEDGDISYLMEMETILTNFCSMYEGVTYLGATPIAERP